MLLRLAALGGGGRVEDGDYVDFAGADGVEVYALSPRGSGGSEEPAPAACATTRVADARADGMRMGDKPSVVRALEDANDEVDLDCVADGEWRVGVGELSDALRAMRMGQLKRENLAVHMVVAGVCARLGLSNRRTRFAALLVFKCLIYYGSASALRMPLQV